MKGLELGYETWLHCLQADGTRAVVAAACRTVPREALRKVRGGSHSCTVARAQ